MDILCLYSVEKGGLGFGVWGLGFGVWSCRLWFVVCSLEFGLWDLSFEFVVWNSGFGIWNLEFGPDASGWNLEFTCITNKILASFILGILRTQNFIN